MEAIAFENRTPSMSGWCGVQTSALSVPLAAADASIASTSPDRFSTESSIRTARSLYRTCHLLAPYQLTLSFQKPPDLVKLARRARVRQNMKAASWNNFLILFSVLLAPEATFNPSF
ncbi:MAG: hypothetical protein ABI810_15410 [Sphingomonas bacterium]